MIIVFDLKRPQSFEGAKKWYFELTEEVGQISVVILCGNKLDLDPNIDTSVYERWAQDNKIMYINVSALDGSNIHKLFFMIAEHIYRDIFLPDEEPEVTSNDNSLNKAQNSSGSCC